MVFAVGPAGTGKTYLSIALAVRALKDKVAKKIILQDLPSKLAKNWDSCQAT